jgi:hypothetical protein
MAELSGFPYGEVKFDKTGSLHDQDEVLALIDLVETQQTTDLVAISHGWNNDIAEARALYERFFAQMREVLDAGSASGLPGRRLAVMGIFWPSKKFADAELIPGGAASLGGITDAVLMAQLAELRCAFDADDADQRLQRAMELVTDLEDRRTARDEFGALLTGLLGTPAALDDEIRAEIPDAFFELSGSELIDRLSAPGLLEPPPTDDRDGGAAGLGDFFGGVKAGARRLANLVTFWQMKKRAGIVGAGGVFDVLSQLRVRFPTLKLHLVGHSFGGRVVTAAARGADGQPGIKIESMTLLQAAFSHNGFAEDFDVDRDGYFRRVVIEQGVTGPILITHTVNDRAVGLAYPLAVRISRDDAAGLGDKNDRFGGIGRNGAQHTPEAQDGLLLRAGGQYAFRAGSIFNLQADAHIRDHSDVANAATAHAVVSAIAMT